MKVGLVEGASYVGSGAAVGASLSLNDIGVIVGLATALLTFAINAAYVYRKDRREERESNARLHELERHDG
ncbi:HP1 family phage holin [Burkholderia pseudomallei]|uniref:HP1 family phage holin n=1 Tax=Burkholderia pseudomallei TaxID=28450 RepID=UPI0022DC0046|nr:HP1 family phage holin [Burkholderia pseudomallei]MDA0560313.1 phage holin family protein [Burkholderia pseudomallei]